MSSLNANFDELIQRVKTGREFNHASFEPIYYLIFEPKEILQVKRSMPGWLARLRNDGWDVLQFSIADEIDRIFKQAPLRKIWLAGDRKSPQAWDKTNSSLANALANGVLQNRLEERLNEAEGYRRAMVLVTDLEALHPYMRIGTIEGQLSGKIRVPTLFLYPGKRMGKTRLKFLGFYPEDGNYRSVHVGG